MILERIICGALYDFAASLTTSEERIVASSHDEAGAMAERVGAFIEARGLSEVAPSVSDWESELAAESTRANLGLATTNIKIPDRRDQEVVNVISK